MKTGETNQEKFSKISMDQAFFEPDRSGDSESSDGNEIAATADQKTTFGPLNSIDCLESKEILRSVDPPDYIMTKRSKGSKLIPQ